MRGRADKPAQRPCWLGAHSTHVRAAAVTYTGCDRGQVAPLGVAAAAPPADDAVPSGHGGPGEARPPAERAWGEAARGAAEPADQAAAPGRAPLGGARAAGEGGRAAGPRHQGAGPGGALPAAERAAGERRRAARALDPGDAPPRAGYAGGRAAVPEPGGRASGGASGGRTGARSAAQPPPALPADCGTGGAARSGSAQAAPPPGAPPAWRFDGDGGTAVEEDAEQPLLPAHGARKSACHAVVRLCCFDRGGHSVTLPGVHKRLPAGAAPAQSARRAAASSRRFPRSPCHPSPGGDPASPARAGGARGAAGPAARGAPAADADEEDGSELGVPDGIKLGMGDFIFYSVLVGRAAMYDMLAAFAAYLGIVAGLGATMLLLALARKALPALPISIALGTACYFLARGVLEPFVLPLSVHLLYM